MKLIDQAKDLLQNFSLSPQEAELYLLLLQQGACNVADLASIQKRNRTAVYFHLNHLVERGLVKEVRTGRRALYTSLSPSDLVGLIDRKMTDFKALLPQLELLARVEKEKPMIEVIESTAGFKRIYDEISSLPMMAEFLVLDGKLAVKGELDLLSENEWRDFFKKIVDRKILTRAVFTEESMMLPRRNFSDENKKLLRSRLWDLRTLPESSMPLDHLLMMYGDKAVFFIPSSKLLFTIGHSGIVGILKAMFETIHGLAKVERGGW